MANWQALQQNLNQSINNYFQQQQEKQKQQQALQQLILPLILKQQMEQQSPEYKMNQLKLGQSLQDMQSQQQFNRNTGIAFGGQRPTAQEIMPMVPQNLQKRFAQRPVSPPGLINQYRQNLQKNYFRGQSYHPTKEGYELTKPNIGMAEQSDITSTAEGIIAGEIPPDRKYYRDTLRVDAELKRQKFNLSDAANEWKATQRFLNSMNSEKQVRLRQAITSTREALDGLSQLNEEYKRSNLAPLNSAQLIAQANSGNQLAVRYLGQINIIRDELAQVFMGGNSPTDKALDLAKETLNKNWSPKQLQAAIDNIDINLKYRENAINYANVYGIGGGGGTRYSPANQMPEASSSGKQFMQGMDNERQIQNQPKQGRIGKYSFTIQ